MLKEDVETLEISELKQENEYKAKFIKDLKISNAFMEKYVRLAKKINIIIRFTRSHFCCT